MATTLPSTLEQLADRYDPSVFELTRSSARVRLAGAGSEPVDAVIDGDRATLEPASDGRPDALLSADARTWAQIARDVRGGMDAFRSGRLRVRYDLHLGVGFLAATADSLAATSAPGADHLIPLRAPDLVADVIMDQAS